MEDIIQLDKPENEASEQIIVKSDLRDKATYYDPSYYQINFENPYKKVFSFEVLYSFVPRTEYIIDVLNNQLAYSINDQCYKILEIDPGDQDLTQLVQNMDQMMYDTVYNENTGTKETIYITVRPMSNQIQYKSKLVFSCKYPFRFDFSQSTAQQPLGFGNYANPQFNTSQYNGVNNVQDYICLNSTDQMNVQSQSNNFKLFNTKQNNLIYYYMFNTKQPQLTNIYNNQQGNTVYAFAQKFLSTQIQILNKVLFYFNIPQPGSQQFTVQIYSHDTVKNQPLSYSTKTYLAQSLVYPTTGQQSAIANFKKQQLQIQGNTYYWVVIILKDPSQYQLYTYYKNYNLTTDASEINAYTGGTLVNLNNNQWSSLDVTSQGTSVQLIQQLSIMIQTYLNEAAKQIYKSVLSTTNTQGYLFNSKQPQLSDLYQIGPLQPSGDQGQGVPVQPQKRDTYAQIFYNTEIQNLGKIILFFNVISANPDTSFTISIFTSTLPQPLSTQTPLAQSQIDTININTGKLATTVDFTSYNVIMLANTYYWVVIQYNPGNSVDQGSYQIYTYQKFYNQITDAEAITVYGNGTLISTDIGNDSGTSWSTLNPMQPQSGLQPIEQLSMQVITYQPYYYMNSPGMVQLIGQPYVVMRCREIETHFFNVNYDTIKHFGVGLIPLGINGFVNTTFNFEATQKKKFHPIGQLQSLTIEFTRPDGTRYNFKGIDHVIVCNIKFYRKNRADIPKQMRFSLLNPSLDFRDGDNYYEYRKNFMYDNNQRQLQNTENDIDDSVNSDEDQYYEKIEDDSQQYVNKDLFINLQKQDGIKKYDTPDFSNKKT